jgi:hypothetical protein
VTELKQWGEVTNVLGFGKDDTVAAAAAWQQVKQIYVKYIVPFEAYLKTTIFKEQQNTSSSMKSAESSSMKTMKSMKKVSKPGSHNGEHHHASQDEKSEFAMDVDTLTLDSEDTKDKSDTPPQKKKKPAGSPPFLITIKLCYRESYKNFPFFLLSHLII